MLPRELSADQDLCVPPTLVTFPAGSCHEEAAVLHVVPDPRAEGADRVLVVTDVTPFHPLDPLWPDQPADHGELRVAGQVYQVRDVVTVARRGNGPIMVDDAIDARRGESGVRFNAAHVLSETALLHVRPQARVTLLVDVARRRRLSAAHTACHLLAYALNQETHQLWREPVQLDSRHYHDFDAATCVYTRHDLEGSVDKYRLGKSLRKRGFESAEFVAELPAIIERVNHRLAAWIASDAMARIDCEGPRLTDRRRWTCELPEAAASMPCGGTHVQRLGEIRTMTAAASFDRDSGLLTIRNEVQVSG